MPFAKVSSLGWSPFESEKSENHARWNWYTLESNFDFLEVYCLQPFIIKEDEIGRCVIPSFGVHSNLTKGRRRQVDLSRLWDPFVLSFLSASSRNPFIIYEDAFVHAWKAFDAREGGACTHDTQENLQVRTKPTFIVISDRRSFFSLALVLSLWRAVMVRIIRKIRHSLLRALLTYHKVIWYLNEVALGESLSWFDATHFHPRARTGFYEAIANWLEFNLTSEQEIETAS